MNTPEYQAHAEKVFDEARANLLLKDNGFKELMKKGLTLEQAKKMVEADV